jgi:hypothetical protein
MKIKNFYKKIPLLILIVIIILLIFLFYFYYFKNVIKEKFNNSYDSDVMKINDNVMKIIIKDSTNRNSTPFPIGLYEISSTCIIPKKNSKQESKKNSKQESNKVVKKNDVVKLFSQDNCPKINADIFSMFDNLKLDTNFIVINDEYSFNYISMDTIDLTIKPIKTNIKTCDGYKNYDDKFPLLFELHIYFDKDDTNTNRMFGNLDITFNNNKKVVIDNGSIVDLSGEDLGYVRQEENNHKHYYMNVNAPLYDVSNITFHWIPPPS